MRLMLTTSYKHVTHTYTHVLAKGGHASSGSFSGQPRTKAVVGGAAGEVEFVVGGAAGAVEFGGFDSDDYGDD